MRLALLLLALAPLAACSQSDLGDARSTLRENEAVWNAASVASYRMTYRERCFCASERTTVVVRGGAVDSVYVGEEGEPQRVEAYDPARHWDVGALFDVLEASLDREPEVARIQYNTELGYPVEAAFDYDRGTLDEEDGFGVSDFEVLGSGGGS